MKDEETVAPKPSNKIEMLANLATLIVAVVLSVVLVKEFLLPKPSPPRPFQAAKGTSLKGPLRGVDWAGNGRTLVLAISTRCHFCTESAPFFQRIERERGRGVKLLAVLPQPPAEALKYLQKESVHVDDVRQARLDSIGVNGTPTLLLVDNTGTVADVWQGKLPSDQEEEVLAVVKKDAL